jgi:hypothetical protein
MTASTDALQASGPLLGMLYLGMISGTSADGIDVAVARFHDAPAPRVELAFGRT